MKLTEEMKQEIIKLFRDGKSYTDVFNFYLHVRNIKLHPEQLIRIKKLSIGCKSNKYVKDIINASECLIDIRNGIKELMKKTTIRTTNLKHFELLLDSLEHYLQELHQKVKQI